MWSFIYRPDKYSSFCLLEIYWNIWCKMGVISLFQNNVNILFNSDICCIKSEKRGIETIRAKEENKLKGIKAQDKDLTRGEYLDPTPKGII